MNSKIVTTACCTEAMLIANEPCGRSPDQEAEFYV
jgi:hypothetical protein